MEEVEKVQTLPEFVKATELVKEKKYNDAVEAFSMLLSELVEQYGDLGTALGPVYYAYGSACLLQVESSANVFGDMVKHEKEIKEEIDLQNQNQEASSNSAAINTTQTENDGDMIDAVLAGLIEEYKKKNGEEPTDEVITQWKETFASANLSNLVNGQTQSGIEAHDSSTETEVTSATDTQPENEKAEEAKTKKENPINDLTAADIDDLMGVAWECLETSRVIFGKLLDNLSKEEDIKEVKKLLAKTLLRLGDHSMEIGRFEQSIDDYKKCIKLREEVFDVSSRELPDVYSAVAYALLYASTEEKDPVKAVSMRFLTLEYYAKAMEGLLIIRQDRLKCNRTIFNDKISISEIDEGEEIETDKSKGKAKAVSEKPLELTSGQLDFVKKAKDRIETVLKQVRDDTMESVGKDIPEAELALVEKEVKDLGEVIEELGNKMLDIAQVLENPEAAEAISGGAQAVEEALANAKEADESSTSAFDKPTLSTSENVQTLGVKRKSDVSKSEESKTIDSTEPDIKKPKQ